MEAYQGHLPAPRHQYNFGGSRILPGKFLVSFLLALFLILGLYWVTTVIMDTFSGTPVLNGDIRASAFMPSRTGVIPGL